jgi:hypothetical protein
LKTQKKKNALTSPAHRPGEKGEKQHQKNIGGKLQNKKQEQEAIPLFFLALPACASNASPAAAAASATAPAS